MRITFSLTNSLSGVTSGMYLIRTRSGSQQVINLDRMTICRIAPPGTKRPLRQDDAEIDILFMGKCEVGRELILIVDLHLPGIASTFAEPLKSWQLKVSSSKRRMNGDTNTDRHDERAGTT